jgi:predicted lipoprotein
MGCRCRSEAGQQKRLKTDRVATNERIQSIWSPAQAGICAVEPTATLERRIPARLAWVSYSIRRIAPAKEEIEDRFEKMANWPKKDEALIERVDALLSIAPVRRKNMFGTAA